MNRSHLAGFTLVELMVVVVITAILASIAVPAYTSSMRKSRRTEAKTTIMDLAAREERFFATQQMYTTSPSSLAYGSGAWPISTGTYYQISSVSSSPATATTPGGYVLQVTPSAGSPQLQDTSCQLFQVDQTGKQSSQDGSGNDTSTTCWP
jgi:type IV pilus assembly protein PilE